jgi:hypothetical protein
MSRVSLAFDLLPLVGKNVLLVKIGEHTAYETASSFISDHGISRFDFEKSAKVSLAAMKNAITA